MYSIDFKSNSTKRSYYVDGDEKTKQIQHLSKFINKYIIQIKPMCHRWVQLRSDELLNKNIIGNYRSLNGDCYLIQAGIDMFEFHVDDHKALQEIADIDTLQFGWNVSVIAKPG